MGIQNFPFPKLVTKPKFKNPVYPIIEHIDGGGVTTDEFMLFPKGITPKLNAKSLFQDLN